HTNFNCKKEGGFYTQEQLKELVAFARERFIEIMPEIDMPGHMLSAIACYKELTCFERNHKVASHWGVKHDILCGGKDITYKFCKDIIDELCEVFDGQYIHIGGDEAPKFRWNVCPNCQAKMKSEGLKNTEELQLYFTNVMADYIASKGKKTMMWYEDNEQPTILKKEIIQEWWGTNVNKKFEEKIKNGTPIFNANSSAYYIDLPYGKITLKDSYNAPTEFGEPKSDDGIVGMEACLWTEYVKNLKKAKFNTFPRFCAITEAMWTPTDKRDYKTFLVKLDTHKSFLKRYNITLSGANVYNPNCIRKFFSSAWFEKRQLTWQGLHFVFDDAKIRRLAKKNAKKAAAQK
ncbi:MAG: family 20 glycosylhydrolase, partial [Clostridia bacterium]